MAEVEAEVLPLMAMGVPPLLLRSYEGPDMQTSMYLGQFRHAGCDKNAKLTPAEQEIGQNHQKLLHFTQIPLSSMLSGVVAAWSSRRLSLKTGRAIMKVTSGTRLVDVQSSFASFSKLTSHCYLLLRASQV